MSTKNALGLAKLNLVQLLQLPASEADGFELVRPSMKTSTHGSALLTRGSRGLCPGSFPEIRQAELQVEDAFIGLDIAKANRYPRLFASYNIGTGYSGASRSIDGAPSTEEFVLGSLVVDDSTSYDLIAQQEVYNFITTPFNDQLSQNFNQSVFFSMTSPSSTTSA